MLRRALADILPVEVQWRSSKSNLGPNFEHGLLAYERQRLEQVILKESGTIEKYVNIGSLREAYHRFASGEGETMHLRFGRLCPWPSGSSAHGLTRKSYKERRW